MSTTDLRDFLKRAFPDIGLPPAKVEPSRMAFPEMRPVTEPGLHDTASMGEWVVRDWVRLVDAGRSVRPARAHRLAG